jgi:formylglycine-generating enzyme required for sulfatase activity/serine/threonine protein kinase
MPIRMRCPNPACGRETVVPDQELGHPIRCLHCNTRFVAERAAKVAPTSSALPPGAFAVGPEVIGRYEIREELGSGAFGTVYRAFDPRLDREVALKVLCPKALASPQAVERFHREAKVAARLRHPHIVTVFDFGEHNQKHFIVSDFIAGCTLSSAIPEGGMEPSRAVSLGVQLAEALGYAHQQGVLHRDVKPANILLDHHDQLYLMDFGLAGWTEPTDARLTKIGTLMGTPAFMAPEQARGDTTQVGPSADLYAAGGVLYEMLTGKLPFEGPVQAVIFAVIHQAPPAPSVHRPGLDPQLEAICLKALAKKPEDRYPTGREMAAVLQGWLQAPVPSPSTADKPAPRLSRRAPATMERAVPRGSLPGPRKTREKGDQAEESVSEGSPRPLGGPRADVRATLRNQPESSRRIPPTVLPPPLPPMPTRTTEEEPTVPQPPAPVGSSLPSPELEPTGEKWPNRQGGRILLAAGGALLVMILGLVWWIGRIPTRKDPVEEGPGSPVAVEDFDLGPVDPVTLKAGETFLVPIAVERRGYRGPIRMTWEGLPAGVSFDPVMSEFLQQRVQGRLLAADDAPAAEQNARLVARGGKWRRVREVLVKVRPVVRVRVGVAEVLLEPGGPSREAEVTIDRRSCGAHLPELLLKKDELPASVTVEQAAAIPTPGQSTVRLLLRAGENAPAGSGRLTLTGRIPVLDVEESVALPVRVEVLKKESVVKEDLKKEFTNDLGMKLVLIPGGTFKMGSPEGEAKRGNDEEQHDVEISPFYLGRTEVTQKQFREVMNYNPSSFSNDAKEKEGAAYLYGKPGGGKDKVKGEDTELFPVENVSWDEANEFCEKLTNLDKTRPSGWMYRLPREAEWEYACRGGGRSYQTFHFGNSISGTQANFFSSFPYGGAPKVPQLNRTSKVGSYSAKAPHPFGLCDMHGNVWEWCADWYDKDYYKTSPVKDPPGPSKGSSRVYRGGAWSFYGQDCRSANRVRIETTYRFPHLGFRAALVPEERK